MRLKYSVCSPLFKKIVKPCGKEKIEKGRLWLLELNCYAAVSSLTLKNIKVPPKRI
jgi:hypothetical protein